MENASLFTLLVTHTHAVVDRRGEAHINCPECGSESSPRNTKCSFSENGFFCFVCGYNCGLVKLADTLGLNIGDYRPVKFARPEKPANRSASWLTGPLVTQFAEHPRRNELWNSYKPITVETIERMSLGVGVLPHSRCKHERLIVPVWNGPQLVGLRGRQLDCDCGKWLASAGWSNDLAPLYNSESLGVGQVIWILENPVDALLLSERTEYAGVATYSVSYWTEAWTNRLIEAQPELVVVAYDQDLPGNGGAARRAEFEREWLKTHRVLPPSGGVKLVNRLLEAGLPATLYDWGRAEHKADIGNVLMQKEVL